MDTPTSNGQVPRELPLITLESFQFLVPEEWMGMIMGKGGSNIVAIKQATGCAIQTDKTSIQKRMIVAKGPSCRLVPREIVRNLVDLDESTITEGSLHLRLPAGLAAHIIGKKGCVIGAVRERFPHVHIQVLNDMLLPQDEPGVKYMEIKGELSDLVAPTPLDDKCFMEVILDEYIHAMTVHQQNLSRGTVTADGVKVVGGQPQPPQQYNHNLPPHHHHIQPIAIPNQHYQIMGGHHPSPPAHHLHPPPHHAVPPVHAAATMKRSMSQEHAVPGMPDAKRRRTTTNTSNACENNAGALCDSEIKAEMTLSVPFELGGMVIGRGGERVKQIQMMTGAEIKTVKLEPGVAGNPRKLQISGSFNQVDDAVAEFRRIFFRGPREDHAIPPAFGVPHHPGPQINVVQPLYPHHHMRPM